MIFKINKNDGKIQYQINLKKSASGLDDIVSYAQPKGTNFLYGCGQEAGKVSPGYFKITSSGETIFYRTLNVLSNSLCQGLTYNVSRAEVTLLLQSD